MDDNHRSLFFQTSGWHGRGTADAMCGPTPLNLQWFFAVHDIPFCALPPPPYLHPLIFLLGSPSCWFGDFFFPFNVKQFPYPDILLLFMKC